jgi:hypothetical protein
LVDPPPVALGVAEELPEGDFDCPPIVATATPGAFEAGSRTRSPTRTAAAAVAISSK